MPLMPAVLMGQTPQTTPPLKQFSAVISAAESINRSILLSLSLFLPR